MLSLQNRVTVNSSVFGGGLGFTETLCSYYFDGSNNYIDNGDILDGIINGANKTFGIRTVFKKLSATGWLFSQWTGTGNQKSMMVLFNADVLTIFFSSDGSTNSGTWTASSSLTDTDWHDLVINYVNGVVTVYLDSVAYAGTSSTIPTTLHNSTASILTGAINGGLSVYTGYTNQLQITSDEITALEAVSLWNGGSPRLGKDILDNVALNNIYDNDTWDGSNWAVINTEGANGATVNMIAVDHDCNENPY